MNSTRDGFLPKEMCFPSLLTFFDAFAFVLAMSTTVYPRDSFHLKIHMRSCNYFVIILPHSRRTVLAKEATKRLDLLELRGREMQGTEKADRGTVKLADN